MSFQDWKASVDPKVQATFNLDAELPRGMDFFIMTSSIMGILGSGSLAAYNAGNTYQDALARHRVIRGEYAVSVDVGGVRDAGYVMNATAERKKGLQSEIQAKRFVFLYVRDIIALMEMACDPDGWLPRAPIMSQLIIGIRPPSHWKHVEDVPRTMASPFWGHMHHVPAVSGLEARDEAGGALDSRKKIASVADRLKRTETLAEAAEVVTEALSLRVGRLLGTAEEDLEPQAPMHSYGLDSLSAIHVRNWAGKTFDVDLPVFEILGGASFADTGLSIAQQVKNKQ